MTTPLIADRYRMERKLGQGAFGQVFLAQDTRLGDRAVALKLLHPVYAIDPAAVQRFRREANVLAQLDHPAIVPVYDAGLAGDQLYLVMRYLPGGSLAQMVAEQGALAPERVLALLRDLAEGLDHAHAAGVIHRDLKPGNLLLDGRGHAVITDFGLARAVLGADSFTGSGTGVAGTTHYLAPEVLEGEEPTPASDRYALGCVLYELLSGQPPFTGATPMAVMYQHVNKPAPALALKGAAGNALAAQVAHLLAKDPAQRPDGLAGVVAAIDAMLAVSRAQVATPPTAQKPPPVPGALPVSFDWVTIPAGAFTMGSTEAEVEAAIALARTRLSNVNEAWYRCELPQQRVYVGEFRMSRTPVTVAQFRAFVTAMKYRTTAEEKGTGWVWNGKEGKWVETAGATWRTPLGPGSSVETKLHHPVTQVSWHDAVAFCEWAGVRLPTEAEWEKGARGTDGRQYPWGDEAADKSRCNWAHQVGDTTPVGEYGAGASPYGLLDMAGNVFEWTSTRWGGYDWDKPGFAYPYDAGDGREELGVQDSRVARGGGWVTTAAAVRCAHRVGNGPLNRNVGGGFRVVSPGF